MLLLYHVTGWPEASAIERQGILCAKATGREQVVWLVSASRIGWALAHVSVRHGYRVEQLQIIECRVPRTWLRRFRRGMWRCLQDIPAGRTGQPVDASQYLRTEN